MTFEWHKFMDDKLAELERKLDASKTENEILKKKLEIAMEMLACIISEPGGCMDVDELEIEVQKALTDIGMLDREDKV